MARLKSNRTEVYIRQQNPALGNPAHRCSRILAAAVVLSKFAAWADPKAKQAICLLTDEPWQTTKNRFREAESRIVPKLLPPLAFYDGFLRYPLQREETNGQQVRARIWMKPQELLSL